jgi:hypothetical protein
LKNQAKTINDLLAKEAIEKLSSEMKSNVILATAIPNCKNPLEFCDFVK